MSLLWLNTVSTFPFIRSPLQSYEFTPSPDEVVTSTIHGVLCPTHPLSTSTWCVHPPSPIHLISSLLPPLTWWGRYSDWTLCPLSHSSSLPRPHWHWQRACVWPDRTARWRGAASDWPPGHRTAACYHLPWCWSSPLTDQTRGGAWGPAIGTKELQKVLCCTKVKSLMENKRQYDSWHGNLLSASVLEGQPLARSCWWTTCSDSCHSYSYMPVYTHCRPKSKFCKK